MHIVYSISKHSICDIQYALWEAPIVKPRPKTPNPLGPAPTQSNPKAQSGTRGLGLTLKSYGPPPPLAFRRPGSEYMVQIEAPNTPECQDSIPSPGGHQREEHRVVHHDQEEHNEGHIQWAWVKVNGVHSSGNSPLQINMLEWTMNHEQKPEPNHSPNHEQNHKQNQEQNHEPWTMNHEPWTMNHKPGLDSIDHPV